MRFSIRDLLWATALVAVCLAWWLDHKALSERRDFWEHTASATHAKLELSEVQREKYATDVIKLRATSYRLLDFIHGYEKEIPND